MLCVADSCTSTQFDCFCAITKAINVKQLDMLAYGLVVKALGVLRFMKTRPQCWIENTNGLFMPYFSAAHTRLAPGRVGKLSGCHACRPGGRGFESHVRYFFFSFA